MGSSVGTPVLRTIKSKQNISVSMIDTISTNVTITAVDLANSVLIPSENTTAYTGTNPGIWMVGFAFASSTSVTVARGTTSSDAFTARCQVVEYN